MKTIGRYTIRGLLGRGGMGRIYKVTLPVIGKVAALKHLDPDPLLARLIGMDKLRDLFIAEARILAGLNHPHIVTINDFDEAAGSLFYVMDYLANNLGGMIGESYQVERPSRAIPVDKALRYARQTLLGLACLHDAGIIHRDIKPFNLLITAQDTIKVCDFGLSKLRGETFAGPSNLNVGSPYYAAPEQEKDPDSVDESADVYAVGVMFYRMLTGALPVTDDRLGRPLPVGRFNQDLDQTWDAVVLQAIARHPKDRFQSADEMIAAIDRLADSWQAYKEKSCQLPSDAPLALDAAPQPANLRTQAVKIPPGEAAKRFRLDALWRPASYSTNQFLKTEKGTVEDQATGLTWQQGGSRFPCTWRQAREYILALNRTAHAGRSDWRLPTTVELITLLKPAPQAHDLCIEQLFDPTQRWLWSGDRRSFTAAYYVDLSLGFVGWQDFSAPYYVRGVCTS